MIILHRCGSTGWTEMPQWWLQQCHNDLMLLIPNKQLPNRAPEYSFMKYCTHKWQTNVLCASCTQRDINREAFCQIYSKKKKKEKLEHHPCLFAKRLRSIHPNQKDQQPSADLSSTNQQVTGFSPWYKQYLYISDKFEFLSVVEHHMYFLNTHIHHIYSLCLKVLRSI